MITLTPRQKAIMLVKKQFSIFVCDSVNLEGIQMTLPEVQTLMDGITVGGYKIFDQQIVLNQIAAWKTLFTALDQNSFEFAKDFVCGLHAIAAKEESPEWGQFRSGNITFKTCMTVQFTFLPAVDW